MGEHEAVAALTKKEMAYTNKLAEVSKWEVLTCAQKTILFLAVGCLLGAGFVTSADMMVQDKFCFRSFAITDSIGKPHDLGGLDGNALTLVKYVGWAALGVALVGCVLNWFFGKWTAR